MYEVTHLVQFTKFGICIKFCTSCAKQDWSAYMNWATAKLMLSSAACLSPGWRGRWAGATGTRQRRSCWKGTSGSWMRSRCRGWEVVGVQASPLAWSGASWTSLAMAGQWPHTHWPISGHIDILGFNRWMCAATVFYTMIFVSGEGQYCYILCRNTNHSIVHCSCVFNSDLLLIRLTILPLFTLIEFSLWGTVCKQSVVCIGTVCK